MLGWMAGVLVLEGANAGKALIARNGVGEALREVTFVCRFEVLRQVITMW